MIDVHGGTLEDSIVTNNSDKVYDSNGGGVYIVANSPTVIDRCVFSNCLNTVYNSTYGGIHTGSISAAC